MPPPWTDRVLPVNLSTVDVIAMDEFALRKGHRYATDVLEPARKRVLWVGEGRSREEIRPCFALLGPAACQRLRPVAMDMNAAYKEEVRIHCPRMNQIVSAAPHRGGAEGVPESVEIPRSDTRRILYATATLVSCLRPFRRASRSCGKAR
jgi:hypothetical protein